MMTYDRNRLRSYVIMVFSPLVLIRYGANSTAAVHGALLIRQFGVIKAIHSDGLNAEQVRRGKTVEVEGCEGKFEPIELIRLGMH